MAGTQINIDLNVRTPNIDSAEAKLKKLNQQKQRLESKIPGFKSRKGKSDAEDGSSQEISATASNTVPVSRGRQRQESKDYGVARSQLGTGAAARDFAQQAEGLGGLVRLYATYAANVFAVSAAFTALREAEATSIMVKGLDQLGAQTGRALGTLAKQFEKATDSSISFRDSLEAVTKGAAGGLTNKQLLDLGKLGSQAARVLGVNATDAISRLTRAVTKLEPELLDELALITRIDPAVEKYARTLQKPVSALTALERQQAFTIAVIDELQAKFGSIDVPANAYDKLVSTLKNLTTAGLELINKVLTPLVNLLSTSPNALTAILIGLGAKIVSQALPALTSYRANLRKTAEEAAGLAQQTKQQAVEAVKVQRKQVSDALELRAEEATARLVRAETKFEQVSAQSKTLGNQAISQLLAKKGDVSEFTEKDLNLIRKIGSTTKENSRYYYELAESIKAAQKAQTEFNKVDAKLKRQEESPGALTPAGAAAAKEEKARKRAATLTLISQAGDNAAIFGISESLRKLNEGVKADKLGALRGTFTRVAGGANILVGALTALSAVISRIFFVVGTIVAAYQALDWVFSKNTESLAKLNDSFEANALAVKEAKTTQEKWKDSITVDSILAQSSAVTNLMDQLKALANSYRQAEKDSLNWWDSLKQGILSIVNLDIRSNTADQIADNWIAQINSTSKARKEETKQAILKLLGIRDLNKKDVAEAIKKQGIIRALDAGQVILEGSAKLDKQEASRFDNLTNSFNNLDKAYQEFSNTFVLNTPQAKFFSGMLSSILEINKFLAGDNESVLAGLKKVIAEKDKLTGLPQGAGAEIAELAESYIAVNAEIDKLLQQKKIEEVKKTQALGEATKKAAELSLNNIDQQLRAYNSTQLMIAQKISGILNNGIGFILQKVDAQLSIATARANLSIQQNLVSKLEDSRAKIQLELRLQLQQIDLQQQEITSQRDLINTIKLDIISRERDRVIRDRDAAKAEAAAKGTVFDPKQFNQTIADLNQQELAIKNPKEFRALFGKESAPYGKQPLPPGGFVGAVDSMSKFGSTISEQALNLYTQQLDAQAKLAGLAAQRIEALNSAAVRDLEFQNKKELDFIKAANEQREQQRQITLVSPEFLSKPKLEQLDTQAEFARDKLKDQLDLIDKEAELRTKVVNLLNSLIQKGPGDAKTKAIAEKAKTESTGIITTDKTRQRTKTTLESEREQRQATETRRQEEITQRYREFANEAQEASTLLQAQRQAEDALVTIEQTRFDTLVNMNRLSEQEIQDKQTKFTIDQARLQQQRELQDINFKVLEAERKYREELEKNPNSAARAEAERAWLAESAAADRTKQSINAVADAKVRAANELNSLNTDQKKFTDFATRSFESLGDAIADFTITGKLNFKDLINSMIADFIRMFTRMQMQKLLGPSNGMPGASEAVGGFLENLVTKGSNLFSGFGAANGASFDRGVLKFANGGAFDSSVQRFAKGGMFTNSIVTSPTLFKFAKGTGLMGEAGPEAIMPLTRDNKGRLGVTAQSQEPRVDVVVNNYSSQQATTRETKDSKGNRKIEVVVGEMTASEMTRPGSATQQTLRSSFGIQPTLTRR